MLSPTRWITVFRTVSSHWADYLQDDYTNSIRYCLIVNFLCALLDYIAFIHLLFLPFVITRYYHIIIRNYARNKWYGDITVQNNLKYQWNIRKWIIGNFYHGIADIFALCIGIISFLFIVRSVCFFKLFARFYNKYKSDDYAQWRYAMVINVLLSFIDLVFVILTVCVLCSLIRTFPLIADLKQHRYGKSYIVLDDDYKLNYNYQWRKDILKHFAFIFIDIVFVPLMICCLLSIYQGIEIVHLIKDTAHWNEARMMKIRKQILINFLLLILDVICILPLFLIIICTVYRLKFVANQLIYSWSVYHHNRAIRIRNVDGMASNLVDDEAEEENGKNKARITSFCISTVADNDDNNHDAHRRKAPQSVRIDIFYNVLLILFVDIPFMLVAVVVIMITMYRIPKCIALIEESKDEINNLNVFDDENKIYSIILQCRWQIFAHFIGILCDIPCLILCVLVTITLWRSMVLYRILSKETNSYSEFRTAAVFQTIYLVRDVIFFALCGVIVVTLWRLPLLILRLVSKYRKPRVNNDETVHFKLKQCTLEIPTEGKPMLHIKAEKDAAFALNDDLNTSCRLFVLGTRFWEHVTETFGATKSITMQSKLPNELKHGDGNGFDYHLCRDMEREIEITITAQTNDVRRCTLRDKLQQFVTTEVPLVLQLEHDEKGILFAVNLTIDDLIQCTDDTNDGMLDLSTDINMDEIRAISGQEYHEFVDEFWIAAALEFAQWIVDILHLIIFALMLVIAPWRWMQCVQLLCESQDKWILRQHARVMGMICHSNNIYYKLMDLLFDPMLNDLVKQMFINRQNCINTKAYFKRLCHELGENWLQYIDEFAANDVGSLYAEYSTTVQMDLANYDDVIYKVDHILREMDCVPSTKLHAFVRDHFQAQNILLYLKLLECNANILLMENELKWEMHSIVLEQIHLKEMYFKDRIKYFHQEMQQINVAKVNNKCCNKPAHFQYKLIRYSFDKAILDIMGIIMMIFILCTLYRVIPLVRDTIHLFRYKTRYKQNMRREVGPSLRYGFVRILETNCKLFFKDVKLLLKLIAWSLLILITLVRIFDYISELCTGAIKRGKTSMTLSLAVDIAKNEASQIWSDIYSVFYLLFVWETYKYALSALIFGAFLPSAAFLELFALLFPFIPRKMRQIASMLIWFGLFSTILYVTIMDTTHNGHPQPRKFALFSFVTLLIICGFFIALFCCLKCRKFSQNETNLFQREARVSSRMCPMCHNQLSAYSVNQNVDCEFCKQSLLNNNKSIQENGDNIAILLWSYPSDDYIPFFIRFEWTNVIAIGGILFDVLQLISILFYMFYIDKEVKYEDDALFKEFIAISQSVLLSQFRYESYMMVCIITLIVGTFWVIICSLPLVCEQLFSSWGVPNGYFTKSTLWIKCSWLYSRVLFVAITINLLKLSQCVHNGSEQCIIVSVDQCNDKEYCRYNVMSVISFGLLIFFWFTTSIVLVYKNAQICWQKTDHLDIRYPLAFIHGLQIFQSMYIVFGLSMVLTHFKVALYGCVILSYIMLLWHVFYPLLVQLQHHNHNIIYNFCSVPYFNAIQITLYTMVAYIATLLCIYSSSASPSITSIILYGSGIILLIGTFISFVIYKISNKKRLETLHNTELKFMIQSLTDLYEESSHNECVGNWYKWIGHNKLSQFTSNVKSTPHDLAYLLIEFERHILFQRTDAMFLLNREQWRADLLSFDEFDAFVPCIHQLQSAIKPPPYFSLALNALCNESDLLRNAPKDICFLIMRFVVDTENVNQIVSELLLNNEYLPQFDTQFPQSIIERIERFAGTSRQNIVACLENVEPFEEDSYVE